MMLTLAQVLNASFVALLAVFTYFLKRFADTVYRIEDRLAEHGEQIAEMRGKMGMPLRRRKGDK